MMRWKAMCNVFNLRRSTRLALLWYSWLVLLCQPPVANGMRKPTSELATCAPTHCFLTLSHLFLVSCFTVAAPRQVEGAAPTAKLAQLSVVEDIPAKTNGKSSSESLPREKLKPALRTLKQDAAPAQPMHAKGVLKDAGHDKAASYQPAVRNVVPRAVTGDAEGEDEKIEDEGLNVRGAEEVELKDGEEEGLEQQAVIDDDLVALGQEVAAAGEKGEEVVGKFLGGLFQREPNARGDADEEEEDEWDEEEMGEVGVWEVDADGNVVRSIHNRTHAIELLRASVADISGEGGGGPAHVLKAKTVPWTDQQPSAVMRRRAARAGRAGGAGNVTVPAKAHGQPGFTITALVTVACATAIGSFLSAMVGFAFALTTTSLLANVLGSKVSQPLVAFLLLVNELVLIYRKGLGDFREILTLVAASLCTIPVGIMALLWLDAAMGEKALGILIVAYVLYTIAEFKLPEIQSLWQTVGTGLFAGLTVGAFNIGGPWIAIYGQCRRWRADRFASNMLTYQAPTSVFALTIHVFRGAFADATLWSYIALATPGMLLGGWAGHHVSNMMPENIFRKVTVGLIGVMGVRLVSAGASGAGAVMIAATVGAAVVGIEWWRRRREKEKYGEGVGMDSSSSWQRRRLSGHASGPGEEAGVSTHAGGAHKSEAHHEA